MARRFHKICCDECGVEITWTPVVIDQRRYCCHDCAIGLECDCDTVGTLWEDDVESPWMAGVEGRAKSVFGAD